MSYDLPLYAGGKIFDEQIQVVDKSGYKITNHDYEIEMEDGTIFTGSLDYEGKTQRIMTDKPIKVARVSLTPSLIESIKEGG